MLKKEIRENLIREIGCCELCGDKRNLEVHHIIPQVAKIDGLDIDDLDNLIVVCGKCHNRLTPRRYLQKYGIAKMPREFNKEDIDKARKFYDGLLDTEDIIDLVENIYMPWKN